MVFVIGQVGLAASTHLDGKAGHDHDGLGGGGGGATYIFADSFATPLMVAGEMLRARLSLQEGV